VSAKFFAFYRHTNYLLKLLLLAIALLFGLLWVVGGLTKLDRAVMFVIGSAVGALLVFIYYQDIYQVIDKIVRLIDNIF
jgi:hypothetical protein